MNDRTKTIKLIEQFELKNTALSELSGCDRADVSRFLSGARVSNNLESKICRTMRELETLQERFGALKFDMNQTGLVKLLLSKLDDEKFSILLDTPFSSWFVNQRDGKIQTTPYMLAASAMSLRTAFESLDRIRTEKPRAIVVSNCYCPHHAGTKSDSEEFEDLMGIPAPESKVEEI